MSEQKVLNLSEFWEQPLKVWRNITKYDFRYYYQSGCVCTKNEAHQAYSHDVQYLVKKARVNSNEYRTLKGCETAVKNASNNQTNKYFWDHEVHKLSTILSKEMLAEKELEVLEKVTAATALCTYNRRSEASSSTARPAENNNLPAFFESKSSSCYEESLSFGIVNLILSVISFFDTN